MHSTLSSNHIRSITASMTVVEKMIHDIESSLIDPFKGCFESMEVDITDDLINKNKNLIEQIKRKLSDFKSEYTLPTREIGVSQIILSRKSRCWEILQETFSDQLKGYGKFPEEIIESFDRKIQEMINIIEQLAV